MGPGEGRVRFPLYTPPALIDLLPEASTLYIVLMLLFSCLADGRTAERGSLHLRFPGSGPSQRPKVQKKVSLSVCVDRGRTHTDVLL